VSVVQIVQKPKEPHNLHGNNSILFFSCSNKRISIVLLSQTVFSLYIQNLDTYVKDSALYSGHTLFESLREDRLFPLTFLVVFLNLSRKMFDQYLIGAKIAVYSCL